MDIRSFLSSGSSGKQSRINRFNELKVGKTKAEIRKLEENLLLPEKIPPFVGKKATAVGIKKYSVKINLGGQDNWVLFSKYFRVATYIENNVPTINLLLALLRALDSGKIRYNKEKDRIYVPKQ